MPASFTLAREATRSAEPFRSEFMDKKRYLAYALVAAILAALIYMQFRTWKGFDWATFWEQSKQVSPLNILNAIRPDLLQLTSCGRCDGKSSFVRCAAKFPRWR